MLIPHESLLSIPSPVLPLDEKTLEEKIEEFREWLTPRIDRIEDHEQFFKRVDGYQYASRILAGIELCGVEPKKAALKISRCCISQVSTLEQHQRCGALLDIVNLIYALTGTTDNNIKCQFAPFLRHGLVCQELVLPKIGKQKHVQLRRLPTASLGQYKLERLGADIDQLLQASTLPSDAFSDAACFLLEAYLLCVFDCGSYLRLTSVIESLAEVRTREPLLEVFATYQLRGSAAAMSGHGPEDRLRNLLNELGMCAGVDFNETDVIPAVISDRASISSASKATKTRAYDFVIPFRVSHLNRRVFIQSQIYGGDSGSVSHKNVDQIPLSRQHVRETFYEPIFLEYLDGAGYYTALQGDLKRILEMPDTHGFFQGQTAIFVLPKVLRGIGMLYPADLVSWYLKLRLARNPTHQPFESFLMDRYQGAEIHRVMLNTLESGFDLSDPSIDGVERDLIVRACALTMVDILRLSASCDHSHKIRIPGVPGLGVSQRQLDEITGLLQDIVGRTCVRMSLSYLVDDLRAIRDASP
jgi:hypothetical protein